MPDLTIENAPEETVRALQSIAERTDRTVSAVALTYLPKSVPMSREERLELLQSLRGRPVVPFSGPDSTTLIRRDRDGLSENELSPGEALGFNRKLRDMAARELYPDSAPGLRIDRDTR